MLCVMGIVYALAWPRVAASLDRIAVERAASELASFYDAGRYVAIMRSSRVRLEFEVDSLRAVVERGLDSVAFVRPGPGSHGATLRASRDVIRIGPTGIGYGAANTKLVVWRGAAAESLTTSRLGRLKRWP